MRIKIIHGDITTCRTDAVVNAANPSLMGGGGVDGAIHAAGGPEILKQCKAIVEKQGTCPTGEAVITSAGQLPAKFIVHTVGPVWRGGKDGESEQLAACYRNSVKLALENTCSRIAFPNISTGVYGYPKDLAAQIAVVTILDELHRHPELKEITFVCFDKENELQMHKALNEQIGSGNV